MTGEYSIFHQMYSNDSCPLQIATLMANSLEDAWEKSQNLKPYSWICQDYIIENLGNYSTCRPTIVGDIITDPDGKAYIVQDSGFRRCEEYDSEMLS